MTIADNAYAGDVGPREAYAALGGDPAAILVDVRTRAEWTFVGVPDLSPIGKSPVMLEWQAFPSAGPNAAFVTDLVGALGDAGRGRNVPLYFLCRSGGRSQSAATAMAGAGYTHCYNIAGGFEGPLDAERHRGSLQGWKAEGLPWAQG